MTANAQDAQKYEVTGYMPAFFEQMKQKLEYPMAYENSGIKKFAKWKKEAEKLGWTGGSLEPYAKGKCIGGSYFGNYEGVLPKKKGRTYTECDIDTKGKKPGRGAYVCSDVNCLKKAIKSKALSRAFGVEIPQEIYDSLLMQMEAENNG